MDTKNSISERTYSCNQCANYRITHDMHFPYACRALDFKSRHQPSSMSRKPLDKLASISRVKSDSRSSKLNSPSSHNRRFQAPTDLEYRSMKVAFNSLSSLASNTMAAMALGLLLCSCGSTKSSRSYQNETFASESPFQYYSTQEPDIACEISKRALLSQGYQVDDAKQRAIRGEKFFRPTPDEATRLTITLVCLPSSLGTVIYATALETQFEMKSKGSNAGVSVSAFGSVSLPWALDKDTLVKVGEETVTAPLFYQRLFELIRSLDS